MQVFFCPNISVVTCKVGKSFGHKLSPVSTLYEREIVAGLINICVNVISSIVGISLLPIYA